MMKQRALAGLVLMFMAAFSLGFLNEGEWGKTSALASRGEVAREAARVFNALQPLIRICEDSGGEPAAFTDFTYSAGLPVDQVIKSGVMTGFPDGRFNPQKCVTRGEGAVVFSRLVQVLEKSFYRKPPILPVRPKYQDVPESNWLNGDLARLGGVGALRGFVGGKFLPEQPLRLIELRQLRTAFLEYFGENLFILSGTPPDLVLLPKGVFDRLSCFGWSYSLDEVEWKEVPENGRIHLPEAQKSWRLLFRHSDYHTIGPIEIRPGQLNFWLLLARKDLKKFRDRLLAERNQELHASGGDRLDFHLRSLRTRLGKTEPIAAHAQIVKEQETASALMERFGAEVGEDIQSDVVSASADNRERRVAIPREQHRWGGGPELETKAIEPPENALRQAVLPKNHSDRLKDTATFRSVSSEPVVSKIEGIVLDSLSGKGIPSAVVLADRQSFSTDREGRFELEVSANSMLDLTIYCEGYEPLSLRHRADQPQKEARFLLKPLFSEFDGFVTSFDTGEPIAGAIVRLGDHRTRSGPDGRFSFTRLKPTFYQLFGQAPGFMDTVEFIHISRQEGSPHDLKLKPVEKAWEKISVPPKGNEYSLNRAFVDEAAYGEDLSGGE